MASTRLILVPQYPTPMRYQSWWPSRLVNGYQEHFDEVLSLEPLINNVMAPLGSFSSAQQAIDYEIEQIEMFNQLVLRENDVLLLCDLSFPGLFASVLFHKRPKRCFAICHATSLNRYDYFSRVRKKGKWRVETGTSRIFDLVFVASDYHQQKLGRGWSNTRVIKFPLPNVASLAGGVLDREVRHTREFVSAARSGIQKVDKKLEKKLVERTGSPIYRFKGSRWKDYYQFLQNGKFLIVTSREETYGYQVIDALMVGTIPIAPRAMSYPEILPDCNLYEPGDVDSLIEQCELCQHMTSPGLWPDMFIDDTAAEMLA